MAKLKSAHISLIIGPRSLGCENNLQENMCWESFDVVRFDLGPLVQGPISRLLLVLLLVKRGWASLKVPISSLLLLPEVWDVKLTLNSTFLLPGGRSYHCSGLVYQAFKEKFGKEEVATQ